MADEPEEADTPVGDVLAGNIRRIREDQRISYVELSERLSALGRRIPVLGLRRIERGERRVDVDDLFALASALGAMPVDLLVPGPAEDDEPYSVTPEVSTTAGVAREWIAGRAPIPAPASAADIASAIRWMPKARAQELAAKWIEPFQREWLRHDARRRRLEEGPEPDLVPDASEEASE